MMYETSFATLSDKFFKNSSWPPVEYIEGLVDHDHVFCLLYKVRSHVPRSRTILLCHHPEEDSRSSCMLLDVCSRPKGQSESSWESLPAGDVFQALVCQHTAYFGPEM